MIGSARGSLEYAHRIANTLEGLEEEIKEETGLDVRMPLDEKGAEILLVTPSADLFAGQTDEAELGVSYEQADRLLYLMVDERFSEDDLVQAGFERAFVKKIVARIAGTQFKRVPPIIAKLSQRTVNQDFRYLRDWGR